MYNIKDIIYINQIYNINKVYISCKDDAVYAEVDDKQAHNVDSIKLKILSNYLFIMIIV